MTSLLDPPVGQHETASVPALRPPPWTEQAACLGMATRDYDPFHPPDEWPYRDRKAAMDRARFVCLACPVQVECQCLGLSLLAMAESADGVWGGLTTGELRTLAKRLERSTRKAARCGTRSGYVAHRKRGEDCEPCRAENNRSEQARRKAIEQHS